jgi:hypothetical protein
MTDKWVLFMDSEEESSNEPSKHGYYTGKKYIHKGIYGEVFPVCDSTITNRTKIYFSFVAARNAGRKMYDNNTFADVKRIFVRPLKYVLQGDYEGNDRYAFENTDASFPPLTI